MAKRIVFTETGEVGLPRRGEWYIARDGHYAVAATDWVGGDSWHRPILTRTEETIPDPPKPRQVVFVPKATLGPGDVHDSAFCDKGMTYYSVEVPTKDEVYNSAHGQVHFLHGVNWLADKLGIKIE